ncbi:uncharacterized protein LOC135345274 isoform X2 [Halichondria panicea]|uniref:uncharacterized protein LOC135345274 isoform X2 n=1 Tax=Halichondria panicea TaxID=6063 RepID=UPI00312B8AA7
MPKNSKTKKGHKPYKDYAYGKGIRSTERPRSQIALNYFYSAHSNPLVFPIFQLKLAGELLKLGHTPEKLSKIFKTKSSESLKSAEKKTSNQHILAAFLINEWVRIRRGRYRPNMKSVVDLFPDDPTKRRLEHFSEESTETEYTECSKSRKSFKHIELIITHKGELSGICSYHRTPTEHKKWCFYKIYDEDNKSGSKSIVKTPSSGTGSLSSERLQCPTARVQKVGISTSGSSFAGPSTSRVTLQKLIRQYNLTGGQLSSEISNSDFPYLTEYFDGVAIYSKSMGLTPAEQADVNVLYHREGTQVAMTKCFTLWKTHNPYAATYRALLELLLKLKKEKIADEIC